MTDLSNNPEAYKYMEQSLLKREANGKWIEYWVICRGNGLLFYSHRCELTELRDAFRGFIELSPGTKCLVGKRKKYNFPFYLVTNNSRYYFKCPTLLLRHQWIYAIGLAIECSSLQGRFPTLLPTTLLNTGPLKRRDTIEEEGSSNDFDSSNENLIKEHLVDKKEDKPEPVLHTEDLPRNIIMVTSLPSTCTQVTNFTDNDISAERSNYTMTNFLSARDKSPSNSPNGFDNLSFEEDNQDGLKNNNNTPPTITKSYFHGNDISSRPASSPVVQVQSSVALTFEKSDKWLFSRVTRSADSQRDPMAFLAGSSQRVNSSFLSIKPTSSNLANNTSRFSRHLISSAPDLKSWGEDPSSI